MYKFKRSDKDIETAQSMLSHSFDGYDSLVNMICNNNIYSDGVRSHIIEAIGNFQACCSLNKYQLSALKIFTENSVRMRVEEFASIGKRLDN